MQGRRARLAPGVELGDGGQGASHHSQKNFLRLDEIIREIDVMMMIMMSRASIVIIVELRLEII